MQLGVGMINARDMLIFGGMAAEENGGNGDALSDAFFFDVDSHTFIEAASLRDPERFERTDEVKIINGKLYAICGD